MLSLSSAIRISIFSPGGGDGLLRKPDLVKIMASADPRLIVLMTEDVISCPRKDPGKGVADRLDALACLAADLDGIVHRRSPLYRGTEFDMIAGEMV